MPYTKEPAKIIDAACPLCSNPTLLLHNWESGGGTKDLEHVTCPVANCTYQEWREGLD